MSMDLRNENKKEETINEETLGANGPHSDNEAGENNKLKKN